MYIITNAMKSMKKFRLIDVQIFKFYLLFCGLFLAKLIPGILALNMWWYVLIPALATVYFLTILFKKNSKKVDFIKLWLDRFRNFNMWQITIYKISIVVFGLMLAKVFPELIWANIVLYAIVVWFGVWYFVKMVFVDKN